MAQEKDSRQTAGSCSLSKLKLLHESRLQQQCRRSTILPQPKSGEMLRVSSIRKTCDVQKEFSGKEEDFQQWSKETKAFFAGVIKESEMMLEWAAEQPTEITDND